MEITTNNFRLITSGSNDLCPEIIQARDTLYNGTGAGGEMRGYLTWAQEYKDSEEHYRLKATGERLRKNYKHIVVIGIGGSYLGAKALIEAQYIDYNLYKPKDLPYIYFIASLSSKEWTNIFNRIGTDPFAIIYISKSGGTLEPSAAFRSFYDINCSNKDCEIIAITDAENGTLRKLVNEHNWESFTIPDNIGGRYSVFSPVGLLPVSVANIDTDEVLEGSIESAINCQKSIYNPAMYLANWQYTNNLPLEYFAVNAPGLDYLAKWYQQLYAESSGKDKRGVLPLPGEFSKDLHSVGQYLEQGRRRLVRQISYMKEEDHQITIPEVDLNDNLDYLVKSAKTLNDINRAAMESSFTAHSVASEDNFYDPNPCCKIMVPDTIKSTASSMQYFMESCSLFCYAIEVNPYNQPGVEAYKKIMKEILNS